MLRVHCSGSELTDVGIDPNRAAIYSSSRLDIDRDMTRYCITVSESMGGVVVAYTLVNKSLAGGSYASETKLFAHTQSTMLIMSMYIINFVVILLFINYV